MWEEGEEGGVVILLMWEEGEEGGVVILLMAFMRCGLQYQVPYSRKLSREKNFTVGGYLSKFSLRNFGCVIALSSGHSQVLSRSRGEKLGVSLGSLLHHRLEMVDSVSTT